MPGSRAGGARDGAMVSLERWPRVEAVLDQALELAPHEVPAYLERACTGEPGLHDEVTRLLAACHEATDRLTFLDSSAGDFAAPLLELEKPSGQFPRELDHGVTVGPFTIERRLGGGGMGVVYLATDRRLDRRVALKLLPPWLAVTEAASRRLVQEAKAASRLDHPNIETVYEIGETSEGRLYIAMAYYEGETLQDRIGRGQLDVDCALDLACQIAEGLAAAHTRGIVHRDIKPSNVIVTPEGVAKIVDFGAAKVAGHRLTVSGVAVGTVGYMSPEQTQREEVDRATDIWSLGVVLYEMLTGRRPFSAQAPEAAIYAIRNDEPEPLLQIRPDLPRPLGRVVDRCLRKDPQARCRDAAALAKELRRIQELVGQTDALGVYPRTPGAVVEPLGIEPGPGPRKMPRKVLTQDDSLRSVPPRSHPSPNNLPAPTTSFVGRVAEVEAVRDLLHEYRLVTLTGAGGCGKSRIALEVAIAVLPERPHGVWLVELAPLTHDAQVGPVIATTLGVKEEAGRTALQTAVATIAERPVMLVLDNCEHVAEGCAAVVQALLAGCTNLAILATSRETLAIPGEAAYDVPSLSFPETESTGSIEDCEAVRLFVDRARSSLPEFQLTTEAVPMIAQICRRLDGMPLAIEFAAARVRTISVDEIAARLDDRFRFLSGGTRTALPRHQTLRAAMDWSYQLLTEEERRAFAQLSVFAGTFTLVAAETICDTGDDTAEIFFRLIEKSLVTVVRGTDKARYRLLETVREYAAERLAGTGDVAPARERHADYYLSLAEAVAPRLQGAEQRAWLDILEQEHNNLRAALAWLVERGDREKEVRLAVALWRPCYLRGRYAEGRAWLERALAHEGLAPSLRAEALMGAGALGLYQCDYGEAEPRLQQALELYRATEDKRRIASALTLLGGVARERGEYDRCLALHAEALALCRDVGDDWGAAQSLQMSGFASWLRDDLDTGHKSSGEALARFRDLGDEERVAWALMDLGAVAHYRGARSEARRLLQESLSSFDSLRFKEGIAWSLNLIALTEIEDGAYEAAARHLQDALSLHRELGDQWRMCSVLEALAVTCGRCGKREVAVGLFGAADRLRAEIGTPIPPRERRARDDAVVMLRDVLGDDSFDKAYEGNTPMSLDEACRVAVGLNLAPARSMASR